MNSFGRGKEYLGTQTVGRERGLRELEMQLLSSNVVSWVTSNLGGDLPNARDFRDLLQCA